jgi:hypothetical protein
MTSYRITEITPGQTIDFDAKRGTYVCQRDPETLAFLRIDDDRILGTGEVAKIETFVSRSCGQTGRGKAQYRVELLDGRVFVCGIQEKFPVR